MNQPYYDSDLTDEEWAWIEPLLPPEKPVGKGREVDLRVVLNGIFYRADNGIKWRALPPEFGAWQTVYGYFRLWIQGFCRLSIRSPRPKMARFQSLIGIQGFCRSRLKVQPITMMVFQSLVGIQGFCRLGGQQQYQFLSK